MDHQEGCRTLSELNAQGFEHLQLSIKRSTRQLQNNNNLYKVFESALERYDVREGQLALGCEFYQGYLLIPNL